MNEYRKFASCPMRYICAFKEEGLDIIEICRGEYTGCGEYQMLLTNREYHDRMMKRGNKNCREDGSA